MLSSSSLDAISSRLADPSLERGFVLADRLKSLEEVLNSLGFSISVISQLHNIINAKSLEEQEVIIQELEAAQAVSEDEMFTEISIIIDSLISQ